MLPGAHETKEGVCNFELVQTNFDHRGEGLARETNSHVGGKATPKFNTEVYTQIESVLLSDLISDMSRTFWAAIIACQDLTSDMIQFSICIIL